MLQKPSKINPVRLIEKEKAQNSGVLVQEITHMKNGIISDIFEAAITVGSQDIIVRGRVIDGAVFIGTAFKP